MPRKKAPDPYDTAPQPAEPTDEQKIIQQALAHWKEADEADAAQREARRNDLKFALGDSDNMWQWDASIIQGRQRPGKPPRPCITDNRLAGQIRQVTNEQRQNKPAIKARPVDNYADKEVAGVYDGIIRHIEDTSDADTAYQKAGDYQANAGVGFFRILTEYVAPDSFDQEIAIRPIPDPDTVRMDPFIKTPEGSDQRYCFIHDDLPKEDFEATYGEVPAGDWGQGDVAAGWMNDAIRVAEYFCVKSIPFTLYRLPDGGIVRELSEPMRALLGPAPTEEAFRNLGIQKRESNSREVHWYKLTAFKVLDHQLFESQYIPVLRVVGEEWRVEGETITKGMVRNAKDPQRMVNYYTSNEAETIAQQPRSPWVAFKGQIEDYQDMWDNANTDPVSVLIANHVVDPVTGVAAPPPARQPPPMLSPAFVQGKLGAIDSLKAATNVYDASLGQRSNETSGIAIQRRDIQQETSNYHYLDNLAKAIKHCGRILIDMIPRVYTGRQAARILGEDGSETIAMLQWGDTPPLQRNGEGKKVYNLAVGRYDVTVTVGPSFSTKRQEAGAFMTDVVRAAPQLMGVAGDIIFRNLDVPGADQLADRIKRTLPPNLLDEEDADDKQQLIQAKGVIAQMEEALQNADQIATNLQKERDEAVAQSQKTQASAQASMEKVEVDRDRVVLDSQRQLEQMEFNEEKQRRADELARLDKEIKLNTLALEEEKLGLDRENLDVERMKVRAAMPIEYLREEQARDERIRKEREDQRLLKEQMLMEERMRKDDDALRQKLAELTEAVNLIAEEMRKPKPVEFAYTNGKVSAVKIGDDIMSVERVNGQVKGLH